MAGEVLSEVIEEYYTDGFLPRRDTHFGVKAMSARRLNIGIRSGAERSKALREALRRVVPGDRAPQEPGLYFESIEQLRHILTE
jgi:hypothetical protein